MARMNYQKASRQYQRWLKAAKYPDPRFDNLCTSTLRKEELKELQAMAEIKLPPMAELTPNQPYLRSEVMAITPEMAQKWLEGNVHNRKLRQSGVTQLANALKEGRWRLNGESIIFSSDGVLLDGQHRLYACFETGIPFQSVVVFGADPSTFTTIDQGRHRSPANHLEVAGMKEVPYLSAVAAVAALVIRYRTNSLFSYDKLAPTDIVKVVTEEPEIQEWVVKAKRAPEGLRGMATPIAATLYIGSRNRKEQAEAFVNGWISGSNLGEGSPILALRQRVIGLKNSRRMTGVKWERFLLCVSAWNSFAQNRILSRMNVHFDIDKFPAIIGDE